MCIHDGVFILFAYLMAVSLVSNFFECAIGCFLSISPQQHTWREEVIEGAVPDGRGHLFAVIFVRCLRFAFGLHDLNLLHRYIQ